MFEVNGSIDVLGFGEQTTAVQTATALIAQMPR